VSLPLVKITGKSFKNLLTKR